MVSRKNALVEAENDFQDFLRKSKERLDAEIIGTRYYINEHTPEYDYGDGWSRPNPAKNVKVSGYFDTLEQAREWMDRHEADKGNTLQIRKQHKRRKVTIGWYDY